MYLLVYISGDKGENMNIRVCLQVSITEHMHVCLPVSITDERRNCLTVLPLLQLSERALACRG